MCCAQPCLSIVPGVVMPMARLDAIGVSLYGGSILPGECAGREDKWDAQTVMEVVNERCQ